MDVQMPEMDWHDCNALIRNFRRLYCHIPIIALTLSHAGAQGRVSAAGMNDYIAKPLRALELFTAMMRVLAERAPGCGDGTEPHGVRIAGGTEKPQVEINDRTNPG